VLDSPVELIQATVQVEQPLLTGGRTVGTGFLLSTTTRDGARETLLVTANHVLSQMPGAEAKIGFRAADDGGTWRYRPQALKIRSANGAPLWTRHPSRDVAVIRIQAPPEFAKAAIPTRYLATEDFAERKIGPGDELYVLGFPRGLAANPAGFPILRSGRVASYPLDPSAFPTFLLDFTVFPGNSGGPVLAPGRLRATNGSSPLLTQPFIAGLLTQEVALDNERLEIGVVTHARFVAETVDMLEGVRAPSTSPDSRGSVVGARPASQTPRFSAFAARCIEAIRQRVASLAHALSGAGRRFLASRPVASAAQVGIPQG